LNIPIRLLESLQGVRGFDEASFISAHEDPVGITSIRINPAKFTQHGLSKLELTPVPWCKTGYYLNKRPSFTFDPLFHAGCYYVQEASSMFLEQALLQLADVSKPLKVLDLSAAPGGKSTHLQSLLSKESLLVSNDVIRNRALVLKQNIIKWGSSNVIVTSNDPQHFQRLAGFFDVIVVDAPCSGSGLFRKDPEAVNEWSPENVMLCQGRQKRILADVMPALKEGGILIYSTCSYSEEENEKVAGWLINEQQMLPRTLNVPEEWGIVETVTAEGATGYRFYPDKTMGEGFFLSCFQKTLNENAKKGRPQHPEKVTQKELGVLSKWVMTEDLMFIKYGTSVIAIPVSLQESFTEIRSHLFIQYAGTLAGELIRDKFIPDHALALSQIVSRDVPRVDVNEDEAVKYLQKKDITVSFEKKGWHLLCFKGIPLGWINVLSGRINNYYPKEMRILKQRNSNENE
jgi:16S rRNA C967 or C1407 C5-methylase (RsmB/RsmF family)/NOL1/NOP2/fmu family ribosome biogenesis protein